MSILDMQNDRGYTAFTYAKVDNRKDIIQILLKKGTQFMVQDQFHEKNLLHASDKGHKGVEELLLIDKRVPFLFL